MSFKKPLMDVGGKMNFTNIIKFSKYVGEWRVREHIIRIQEILISRFRKGKP